LVLILSFITRSRPFYALTYYVYKKLGTWWLVYTRLYRLYLKIGVSSNTLIDRADHAAEALKARDMQIHFRHRQARMERHQQQQGVQAYNDGNVDHEGARASEQGVRQVRPGLESAQERPFAEV
jgi:phosphoribosylanthranilate isomerase